MFSENRDLMSFFHWSIAVSCTVPGIVDTDGRTEGRKNGRMKGSLDIPLLLYFPFSKFCWTDFLKHSKESDKYTRLSNLSAFSGRGLLALCREKC